MRLPNWTYRLLYLGFVLCCFSSIHGQNTCASALPIGALPYNSPAHTLGFPTPNPGYTTCGTTNNYAPLTACGNAAYTASEDALFSFKPTLLTNCVTITLNGPGLGLPPILNSNAALFVFDRCPSDPGVQCVASVANSGVQAFLQIDNLKLDTSLTYFIMLDGSGACYPYQLKVENGSCPAGAECSYPLEVIMPFNAVPGSTVDMRADYNSVNSCVDPTVVGNDVVYHIKLNTQKCIRYLFNDLTADATLYISRDCPDSPGAACLRRAPCNKPYCNGITGEMTLAAGDYYFVIKAATVTDVSFLASIEILNPDDNIVCETCNDQENCSSCKNSGFEKLSFNGWLAKYGFTGNPGQTTGFRTGEINNGLTRHTLVTRGNFDTLVSALSVVPPDGGDYAVRLGNCNNNGQAEQLVYTFRVDSNNSNFIYRYAVVLEDPGHDPDAQPYFSINVRVGNANMSCANYEVRAAAGIPGFSGPMASPPNPGTAPESAVSEGSTMYYKDWSTVNVPLLNYMGQVATITFTTKDCSQGGHFGYAYLDASCERMEILRDSNLYCSADTVTLRAPNGFLTYKWSTGENTQTIKVTEKGVYTVTCTTVTGCVVVLSSTILIEAYPEANFDWDFECKDSIVSFSDQSTPGDGNSPIVSWKWYFGDGDSSTVQNPTHKYDSSGTYNVTLIVSTEGGCTDDTLISAPIDLYLPAGYPNLPDTIKLCQGSTLFIPCDTIPLSTYKWSGPNGFSSNKISVTKNNILPSDSGWYKVEVNIKECKWIYDSCYLFIEPLKKPEIVRDTGICIGDTASLWVKGGERYTWSPNISISGISSNQVKVWPSQSTLYSVNIDNDLCPDTVLKVNVQVLSGVVALNMPDTLRACPKGNVLVNPTAPGFDTFYWEGPNGFTENVLNITVFNFTQAKAGYYVIHASIAGNNCVSGLDSIWLDLAPVPIVSAWPKPISICRGDSVQLTASGAPFFSWAPTGGLSNPNSSSTWAKPNNSVQYVVTGRNEWSCVATDTVPVEIKAKPMPNLGPDKSACLGDSIWVNLSGTYDSLLWSINEYSTSFYTQYEGLIKVTVWTKGCMGVDSLNTLFQKPEAFSLGPDTILCENQVYQTNIVWSPVDSVIWSDGHKNLNRDITAGGVYWINVYSGNCFLSDTIQLNFDSIPIIKLPNDTAFCVGGSLMLNAYHPNALKYSWNDGDLSSSKLVGNTGLYKVVLSSLRCSYTDSCFLQVDTPYVFNLGPDRSICQGDSVLFQGPSGSGLIYLWSTGSNFKDLIAKQLGVYNLLVKNGTCLSTDSIKLNVQVPPILDLGPDQNYCEDNLKALQAQAGYDQYWWNTGDTTSMINVFATGNYSLLIRDKLCYASDTVRVVIDTVPIFKLAPPPPICFGDSVNLLVPGNLSFWQWGNGYTGLQLTVRDSGYYGLRAYNGLCHFDDSVFLRVQVPPVFDLGEDKKICIGDSVLFGYSMQNATYLWSTGQTSPFISVMDSGVYVLKLKLDLCTVSDSARLMVDLMPEPHLFNDTLLCEGDSVFLDPNTIGSNFNWNTGQTSPTIWVNQAGTYWVEIINGLCTNIDTARIQIKPLPMLILPDSVVLCPGDKADVTAVSNAVNPQFLWNSGENTATITIGGGLNRVVHMYDGACLIIDSVIVVNNQNPLVKGFDVTLCPDDSAQIKLPKNLRYFNEIDHSPFYDSVIYPKEHFILYYLDSNNCKWQVQFKAYLSLDCERDLYVPNSFTPNGDGVNDYFKVVANGLELLELLIFDRWGELVFKTTEPEVGWDGKYMGVKCKSDVYTWSLIYKTVYRVEKRIFGHVSLLK